LSISPRDMYIHMNHNVSAVASPQLDATSHEDVFVSLTCRRLRSPSIHVHTTIRTYLVLRPSFMRLACPSLAVSQNDPLEAIPVIQPGRSRQVSRTGRNIDSIRRRQHTLFMRCYLLLKVIIIRHTLSLLHGVLLYYVAAHLGTRDAYMLHIDPNCHDKQHSYLFTLPRLYIQSFPS
jgi:hypothetical protein